MRTRHLCMVMTALAMAGCSQNEVTDVSPDANPVVGFSVYTGIQTRGLITDGNESTSGTNTGLKTSGFGVLAYYTGQEGWSTSTANHKPNFMYNQQVTYSDGWTYTPVKYWPNTAGDKISFFAYAPYESSVTDGTNQGVKIDAVGSITGGAPTLTFTLKDESSKMVDLVATNATQDASNKTIDLEKTTSKVPFKFNHVLSRADFKAKLSESVTDTETKVFITGVKILGTSEVTESGTTIAAAETSSLFFKTAVYKWEDGTWDYTISSNDKAVLQTTAYTLDNGTSKVLATTTPSFGDYKKESVAISSSTDATAMFNAGQHLFFIPPTNSGISSEKDMRVLLTYDVVTKDDKLADKHSAITTNAIVSLPKGTLVAGKAYNYIFTIGLEKVTVEATVANWDATNGTDVDAPSIVATSSSASDVITAITAMNTAKDKDKNCNYFVVYVDNASITSSFDVGSATVDKFLAGDQIELNFTGSSSVTSSNITFPTGWTKVGSDITITTSTGKVIYKKDTPTT